jgi:hypothetical protein
MCALACRSAGKNLCSVPGVALLPPAVQPSAGNVRWRVRAVLRQCRSMSQQQQDLIWPLATGTAAPGWQRDAHTTARHGGSGQLAAIPARVTDGNGRLPIWRTISTQPLLGPPGQNHLTLRALLLHGPSIIRVRGDTENAQGFGAALSHPPRDHVRSDPSWPVLARRSRISSASGVPSTLKSARACRHSRCARTGLPAA